MKNELKFGKNHLKANDLFQLTSINKFLSRKKKNSQTHYKIYWMKDIDVTIGIENATPFFFNFIYNQVRMVDKKV